MSDQPLTTPVGGGPSVLGMAQDELEPPYDDQSKQPKTLTKSRHIDNVFYLAGRKGDPDREQYDLMFVTVAADDEEMARAKKNFLGFHINQEAEYLRGATGAIKLPANRAYIDFDDCYYTAVCKWLLPRSKRSKPPVKAMKWGLPILEDEIKRVKPKIICCLGKPAFDLLYDGKISFDDAHGGWFWSKQYNAYLYVMYAPAALIGKPEYYEQFRVDFEEVHRQLKRMQDGGIQEDPVRYEVLRNEQDLRDWLERLREIPDDEWPGLKDEEGHKVFAVDCEWHGRNYLDGKLRTIQFAWTESDAVVIEFRDENNWFTFHIENELANEPFHMICCKTDIINGGVVEEVITDEDVALATINEIEQLPGTPQWLKEHNRKVFEEAKLSAHGPIEDDLPEIYEKKKYAYIGKIIRDYCEEEGVVYVGHHFSADAPWMQYWLGLTTDGRCWMDTEFAQQTVDESSVLSLERGIAMKYTTLGLYNLDLALWKREHKPLWEGGYGYVPSEIILPYSAKDVLAPFRAAPQIKHLLEIQDLWYYYRRILNPFVTDVFTAFHMHGLPTDIQLLDELRELYHFAKEKLDVKFRQRMAGEAKAKLLEKLMELPDAPLSLFQQMCEAGSPDAAMDLVKPFLDTDNVYFWTKLTQHLYDAPNFNIRSPDQMRTWLFDVHGLTPIKSTNQKAKGLPSMAWEKVLELPPERQRIYTPAVDKQSLQILSEEFDTLDELLNLNAVGNVCKAFLKQAEVYEDEQGNEVTEEQGIMSWVCSDKRIRYNLSCTETSRSRTWAPNILNLPSYVNKRIQSAITRVIRECHEEGDLPENLMKWVGQESIPSVRSCFRADPGNLFVESDLKTAEMFALAYVSGDRSLMRILEEPDPEWAVLKPGRPGPYVRVRYASFEENGIPYEKQNPDYIMTVWKDGEFKGKVTEDDLERNPDGSVMHRNFDIHWSVVERTYGRPREEMIEKVHRNAGKVLNFCVAEDELVLTRDRGPVAIRDIRIDDLVWDGVEWVRHEGVIYSGRKPILEYQGLRATRLHDVWTVERGKVKLEEACAKSLTLVRTADASQSSSITWSEDVPGISGTPWGGLLLPEDGVSALRSAALEGAAEHGDGQVFEMSMSQPSTIEREVSREIPRGRALAAAALCCDEAAMRDRHARFVAPLPGEGYQSGVPDQGCVHRVGITELHGLGHPRRGFRPDGQRRELLAGEPAVGEPFGEPDEQGVGSGSKLSSGEAVPGGSPGSALYVEDDLGAHENGNLECRDFDAACAQYCCGEAETYDIVNAGPRHRFTCSGVLVSNSSAYGASPASLERKIESDTGVKPEPGTGQKGLEAIAARQPRATQFLEEMAEIPARGGSYRAASGRIRHCVVHGDSVDIGWRTRKSIESAIGREFRNFPMQESVAATAARACKWALDLYRNLGLKARPVVCLYDSLVTMCPFEERFIVAKLHQVLLSDINGWRYVDVHGDRVLRYGIDTEFNERWSTNVKAYQKQMEDPEYHPTPEHLKWILDFENWDLMVS